MQTARFIMFHLMFEESYEIYFILIKEKKNDTPLQNKGRSRSSRKAENDTDRRIKTLRLKVNNITFLTFQFLKSQKLSEDLGQFIHENSPKRKKKEEKIIRVRCS